jgi:ABC-type Mn2+/Zn2+ transport system permease subunit
MSAPPLELSDYLGLWPAAAACLVVGAIAPLAGALLWLRRQTFLAIALPPVASAACALAALVSALGWLGAPSHDHGSMGSAHLLASAGATILVLIALAAAGGGEGAILWTYCTMSALAVLFVNANPVGETSLLELFNGEAMAIGPDGLARLASVLAAALLAGFAFRKRLVLVSFDPELATLLRWNVRGWNLLLYALVGVTVSLAVHAVGFLAAFSLLLLPTVAVRPFARSLRGVFLAAPICGLFAAGLGFAGACWFDLPVGPACAAAACLLCVPGALGMAAHKKG